MRQHVTHTCSHNIAPGPGEEPRYVLRGERGWKYLCTFARDNEGKLRNSFQDPRNPLHDSQSIWWDECWEKEYFQCNLTSNLSFLEILEDYYWASAWYIQSIKIVKNIFKSEKICWSPQYLISSVRRPLKVSKLFTKKEIKDSFYPKKITEKDSDSALILPLRVPEMFLCKNIKLTLSVWLVSTTLFYPLSEVPDHMKLLIKIKRSRKRWTSLTWKIKYNLCFIAVRKRKVINIWNVIYLRIKVIFDKTQ